MWCSSKKASRIWGEHIYIYIHCKPLSSDDIWIKFLLFRWTHQTACRLTYRYTIYIYHVYIYKYNVGGQPTRLDSLFFSQVSFPNRQSHNKIWVCLNIGGPQKSINKSAQTSLTWRPLLPNPKLPPSLTQQNTASPVKQRCLLQ